jgi:hypothetical protein
MPFGDPVHEIAQRATPHDVRVVYADNDPLVLAHARALLNGPPGATSHIAADLDDPARCWPWPLITWTSASRSRSC